MEFTVENIVLLIAGLIAAGIILVVFVLFHGGAQATQGQINGIITGLGRMISGV